MAVTVPIKWEKVVPTEEGYYFVRFEDKNEENGYSSSEVVSIFKDNHDALVVGYMGKDLWEALDQEAFSDTQFYGPIQIPA